MDEKTLRRIGWVLSGLFAAFMLVASAGPKFAGAAVAVDIMRTLGWPDGYVLFIGSIEVACTVLYLIPATSVLGAVLMMGLLGGAIATQLRVGSPLFSHTLFGIYLGLFMWAGLWLRDPDLRRLFPFRR